MPDGVGQRRSPSVQPVAEQEESVAGGMRAELPFVSMQEVRDGVIVRWWDYWDLATLMNVAPPWWVEHITAEAAKLGLG